MDACIEAGGENHRIPERNRMSEMKILGSLEDGSAWHH